jgi:hypothetical protein
LETILFSPVFASLSLDRDHRILLLKAMMNLSLSQQRRCKALLMDVYKLCSGVSTLDVLVAYADAAV